MRCNNCFVSWGTFFLAVLAKLRGVFLLTSPLVIFLLAKPVVKYFILGLILTVAGEIIRIWASGHIQKSFKVTTSGPYAYLRHPLYAGNFFLFLGFGVMSGKLVILLVFLFWYFIFHYAAVVSEEAFLVKKFGYAYKRYKKNIPCFVPNARVYKNKNNTSFSFSMVTKNNEHKIAIWIFLLCIMFLAILIQPEAKPYVVLAGCLLILLRLVVENAHKYVKTAR